jgi:hypothetical protein
MPWICRKCNETDPSANDAIPPPKCSKGHGTMSVYTVPAAAAAPVTPAGVDLEAIIDNTDVARTRVRVAASLGITDKTHSNSRKPHGANFSSSQTLRSLINDLTSKVQGAREIERVGGICQRTYGFDPWK